MTLSSGLIGGIGLNALSGSALGQLSALQFGMNLRCSEAIRRELNSKKSGFKLDPPSLRKELQDETDEWLKEAVK